MSRIFGYSRPLGIDDDEGDEKAALRSAGATKVVVAKASGDRRADASLSELVKDLRPGDMLLVSRASRLAPSLSRFVAVVAELRGRGIRFQSLAEPALSADGDTLAADDVIVALEALRRELIGLRTREGLADAAREGRRPGRPSVMTPDRVSIARELRAGGRPLSQIARVLGVSPSAVRRALQSSSESS